MKAIIQEKFGGAEELKLADVQLPEPGEHQVLIRVEAAGVHAVDTDIRRGDGPPSMPRPRLPMTPGREVAGIVAALGRGVGEELLGSRVVVHLGFASGGYAEFALAAAASLHHIPDHVSFAAAVAAIGTGRTAQLVMGRAGLTAHDVVIVTGASGGLGSQLVELALAAGCTVIALYGGPAKLPVIEALQADHPSTPGRLLAVDSLKPGWPGAMREALAAHSDSGEPTVLLDGVGGDIGRSALEALGAGGRVVLVGWSSKSPLRVDTADILAGGLAVSSALGAPITDLRSLESAALAAVAEGHVRPQFHAFPLAAAAAAHEAIEGRRSRGKVVLIP